MVDLVNLGEEFAARAHAQTQMVRQVALKFVTKLFYNKFQLNKTLITYQQIRFVITLRFGTVHHVPMIADQHSLLEQSGIRAGIIKLPTRCIAHVVDLTFSFDVRIISRASSHAGKLSLGNILVRYTRLYLIFSLVLSLQKKRKLQIYSTNL